MHSNKERKSTSQHSQPQIGQRAVVCPFPTTTEQQLAAIGYVISVVDRFMCLTMTLKGQTGFRFHSQLSASKGSGFACANWTRRGLWFNVTILSAIKFNVDTHLLFFMVTVQLVTVLLLIPTVFDVSTNGNFVNS